MYVCMYECVCVNVLKLSKGLKPCERKEDYVIIIGMEQIKHHHHKRGSDNRGPPPPSLPPPPSFFAKPSPPPHLTYPAGLSDVIISLRLTWNKNGELEIDTKNNFISSAFRIEEQITSYQIQKQDFV